MCIVSNTYRIGKVRIDTADDRIVPALANMVNHSPLNDHRNGKLFFINVEYRNCLINHFYSQNLLTILESLSADYNTLQFYELLYYIIIHLAQ